MQSDFRGYLERVWVFFPFFFQESSGGCIQGDAYSGAMEQPGMGAAHCTMSCRAQAQAARMHWIQWHPREYLCKGGFTFLHAMLCKKPH